MNAVNKLKTYMKKELKSHNWQKFLLFDLIIIIVTILLLGLLRPDKLLIITYIFTIGYLSFTQRKVLLSHLAVSTIIGFVWTFTISNFYDYGLNFITILGVNIYPALAWSLGLLAAYVLYIYFENRLKCTNILAKIALFITIYWPLLIMAETVAYHAIDIKNLTTASYSGFSICDCLHAPLWMQISYFLLGPLFLILCHLLKLENPYNL